MHRATNIVSARLALFACLLALALAGPGCGDDDDSGNGGDTDTDADTDVDTDSDTDADTDSDTDADTDADTDTDADSDTDTDADSDADTDTYEDGTIICEPDPPTDCSQIGDTPEQQYEGCCTADLSTVFYCEENVLSQPFLCEEEDPGTHCGPWYHPDYGYMGMWCID